MSSKLKKDDKPKHGKSGGAKGDKSQHYDSKDKPWKKNNPRDGQKDGKKESKHKHNCFLYDRDHWVRDCPKKKAFNAMFSETGEK